MKLSRGDLGLSVTRAAEQTGISRTAWSAIENGEVENSYESTVAAVERTLRWERGTWAAIVHGGEPVTVTAAPEPELETPRPGTQVERLQLILAALEDPNVDWDVDADVLELMAKKVRGALQRAVTDTKRDARDAG